MPIKIPNELPAAKVLTDENIFIMTETTNPKTHRRIICLPSIKPSTR